MLGNKASLPIALLGFLLVSTCLVAWWGEEWPLSSSLLRSTNTQQQSQPHRSLFKFFPKEQVTEDGDEKDKMNTDEQEEDFETNQDEEDLSAFDTPQPPPDKQAPPEISGDRRTVAALLENFQLSKQRLVKQIKKDYGSDLFEELFMDVVDEPLQNNKTECTIGRSVFLDGSGNSDKGWARTVRQMKINLLQYLLDGKVQDFVWATA